MKKKVKKARTGNPRETTKPGVNNKPRNREVPERKIGNQFEKIKSRSDLFSGTKRKPTPIGKLKPITAAQKARDKAMKAKEKAAGVKFELKKQLKTAPNGSAKRRNLYKKLGWKPDATTQVKTVTLKAEKIKKEKIAIPTANKVKATAIKKAKPASKSTKRTLKKMETLTEKRKVATAKGKTRKAKRISNRLARVTERGVKRTAKKN